MTSDLHDVSGAFALDALDDDERRRYERHLEECAACRREVADLRLVASRLADAGAVGPPPVLRERVLAEARRTPQLAGPVTALAARRRGGWALPVLAAALVLAVFGLSAALLRTTSHVDELEAALAGAEQARDVVALLESPDARIAELDTPRGVRARFMWSPQQGEGLLMVGDLPAPPRVSTYALWLIDEGRPQFAGAFEPGSDGRAVAEVHGRLASADVIGVTVEPRGPIDQPTSAPFIRARWRSR